jgi:hypothetical protein
MFELYHNEQFTKLVTNENNDKIFTKTNVQVYGFLSVNLHILGTTHRNKIYQHMLVYVQFHMH